MSLIIEAFNGGSHKQLSDLLQEHIPDSHLIQLSGKKWPWRARCGALQLLPQLQNIPKNIMTLFVTSVCSLPEILALAPQLHSVTKILYFHENQLVYPVRERKDRDFQYGYSQILSALAADVVLFNSGYNMKSFLSNVNTFLSLMPDYKPKCLTDRISPKCQVLNFPIVFPICLVSEQVASSKLHIVWPHRWEHDKDPETFIEVIESLVSSGCDFFVSILGQQFTDVTTPFDNVKEKYKAYIKQWGPLESHDDYLAHLQSVDVVVSTAQHEFFGVAMLEGVWAECFPLCPNRLAYPEIYPKECLYNTTSQLVKVLKQLCKAPHLAKVKFQRVKSEINVEQYSWNTLMPKYQELFNRKRKIIT